jgi:hypothetical protein
MNTSIAELLSKNPKVDPKVVSLAEDLEKKLPRPEQPRQGADYKLSPPLGGKTLTITRRGEQR